MNFTLVYLDHDYNYRRWAFQAFDQVVAEAIAIAYCNLRGYTYADLEPGVTK